jgi:hypothetical protein
MHAFADDTTIHCSYQFNRPPSSAEVARARLKAADQLSDDLNKVAEWGAKWHVKFNPSKTEQLAVSHKRSLDLPPVSFMNNELPNQSSLTLLGVIIDSGLLWSQHILRQATLVKEQPGC